MLTQDNVPVEDFRVEVEVTTNEYNGVFWVWNYGREIPTEKEIYDALGAYFSGDETVAGERTLSRVNRLLQEADGQTYHQKLLEKVDAGELDELVPGPQSAWGIRGLRTGPRWATGSPGRSATRSKARPGCKDMSEVWGSQYSCGGRPQPGLHDNDFGDFFWACNGDNQWVPVRRPKPGVDYSHDNDLIRPDPNQNVGRSDPDGDDDGVPDAAKCLYRDEDGNLAPVSRRNPDGTWTTIHGANWDPLAQQCRGHPS